MSAVTPLPRDRADEQVQSLYDSLAKAYGRMPNIFAVMARRPAVLRLFLPFYAAVMREGTVEARYKELAYLKTSLVNGCEY